MSKPKKSLLSQRHKLKRLNFAREVLKLPFHIWIVAITCYLDSVVFANKRSPLAEARAVSAVVWRLQGEGFSINKLLQRDERTGVMDKYKWPTFLLPLPIRIV